MAGAGADAKIGSPSLSPSSLPSFLLSFSFSTIGYRRGPAHTANDHKYEGERDGWREGERELLVTAGGLLIERSLYILSVGYQASARSVKDTESREERTFGVAKNASTSDLP